jgi:hypothetical protein
MNAGELTWSAKCTPSRGDIRLIPNHAGGIK